MTKSESIAMMLAMTLAACASADEGNDKWTFSITPYLWGVGIDGTVGAKGVLADVDVPVSRVLETLDMGAMLSLEARKGRWGLLADGLYMRLSDDTETPGPFFNTVKTTVENGTMDLALAYRVVQGDRGWLDVLAGVRYVYASADLEMTADYAAVDAISRSVIDQVARSARGAVASNVKNAADGIANDLAGLKANIGEAARGKIRDEVQSRIDETVNGIIDRIEGIPQPILDKLKNAIQGKLDEISDAQRDAIAEAAKSRINSRIEAIQGNANAIRDEIRKAAESSFATLRGQASAKVQKALGKAEKELAKAIEDAMTKAADADLRASKEWVDPFVGVRGRLNLTDRTYVGARADVGGFGVGSDLMVQLFGGVGFRPTPNIEIEAGWRYLSLDYDKDNFVYDAAYSGAVIGMRFKL